MLIRIGLLNYIAGALLMPYAPFLDAARALRHDMEALAARFGVSFEQACHRLSTLQRPGARGVPFFFVRVDPAGNVSKRFSAAGFPFARYGGSCPRWVVHTAFAQPGVVQVQVAELPDGAAYLCFARTVTRPARALGRAAADARRGDGLRRRARRREWPTPTAWTWSARRWASACRAGCATGRTAAAAPFRRWSTGWRSTRRPRAPGRTGSRCAAPPRTRPCRRPSAAGSRAPRPGVATSRPRPFDDLARLRAPARRCDSASLPGPIHRRVLQPDAHVAAHGGGHARRSASGCGRRRAPTSVVRRRTAGRRCASCACTSSGCGPMPPRMPNTVWTNSGGFTRPRSRKWAQVVEMRRCRSTRTRSACRCRCSVAQHVFDVLEGVAEDEVARALQRLRAPSRA